VEKNEKTIVVPRTGVGETQLAINQSNRPDKKHSGITFVSVPAPLRYPFYPNLAE